MISSAMVKTTVMETGYAFTQVSHITLDDIDIFEGDPCDGFDECRRVCNETIESCLSPAGTPCDDNSKVHHWFLKLMLGSFLWDRRYV
jgi:hypothetical protein